MIFLDAFLKYADTYGSLIPLVTLAIVLKKRKYPGYCTPLVWYFLFSIIIFGVSNYMADRKINNLAIYNIFTIIELIIITWFFRKILISEFWRKVSILICITFICFFFFNVVFLENINTFNSNAIAVEFMVIILYCFRFYVEFSKSEEVVYFFKSPVFWIISGLFVYFASSIMVFALYKYAAKINRSFILDFWIFQVIMYLVKNLMITKGFLCFKMSK